MSVQLNAAAVMLIGLALLAPQDSDAQDTLQGRIAAGEASASPPVSSASLKTDVLASQATHTVGRISRPVKGAATEIIGVDRCADSSISASQTYASPFRRMSAPTRYQFDAIAPSETRSAIVADVHSNTLVAYRLYGPSGLVISTIGDSGFVYHSPSAQAGTYILEIAGIDRDSGTDCGDPDIISTSISRWSGVVTFSS